MNFTTVLCKKILMLQFIKLANPWFCFYSNTNIIHFQTQERKLFCHQLNWSSALFSFASCDWLYYNFFFFQSWHMLYTKKLQVPTASNMDALLICDSCEPFCNEAAAVCCGNVLYKLFTGKNFRCISQGMKKKNSLLIDLSKFSKIMHH